MPRRKSPTSRAFETQYRACLRLRDTAWRDAMLRKRVSVIDVKAWGSLSCSCKVIVVG